jgi:hypothetical protein
VIEGGRVIEEIRGIVGDGREGDRGDGREG